MILIHDGYMIDPKSGREGNYDILIDGVKIVKIAEKIEPRGKVTRINAEGLLVAPGLVDVHVHFRDPGFTAKEDTLFAIALKANDNGEYHIHSLRMQEHTAGTVYHGLVESVSVLGTDDAPAWTRDENGLHIKTNYTSDKPITFKIKLN